MDTQAVETEVAVKPVSRLQQWEIIKAFGFGAKVKECVVAAPPRVVGDRVKLTLHPLTKRFNKKRVKSFTFAGEATIEVFGSQELKTFLQEHIALVRTVLKNEKRVYPREIYNRLTERGVQCSEYGIRAACRAMGIVASPSKIPEQYRERAIASVLSVLVSGKGAIDCPEIAARIKKTDGTGLALQTVKEACRVLELDGRLISRTCGKALRYRLPLPLDAVGMPVIFCSGSPSEMVGWIERYQAHANGTIYPVVRLITGKELFVSDDTVDPLESAIAAEGVTRIRDGQLETPPIELRAEIFEGLRETWSTAHGKSAGTIYSANLKQVAIALGIAFEHDSPHRFCKNSRGETLDYLHRYYPGWKYGLNVQVIWEQSIQKMA